MTKTKTTTRPATFSFPVKDAEKRLAELILHISQRCQASPMFGATKLNKILWYADFLAYAETGKPLTGVEYMRLPQGPVPRRLMPIRERLVNDGSLAIAPVERFGFVQQRPVALRKADLSVFTGDEIAIVHRAIEMLSSNTAQGVSSRSHGKAWQVAGETQAGIPYEAAFLSDEKVNRYDKARTKELALRYGWKRLAAGANAAA